MTAEPMPAVPSAPTHTMINPLLAIEQAARLAIPVPTGALNVTQSVQTGIPNLPPTFRWSISHFPPNIYTQCTLGEGPTPDAALSDLIKQLTPCAPPTPSA